MRCFYIFSACIIVVSTYNMVVLAAERQFAITRPFLFNPDKVFKLLPYIFTAEWLVVMGALVILPLGTEFENGHCAVSKGFQNSNAFLQYIPIYHIMVILVIPISVMVVCYGRSWYYLKRSSKLLREIGVRVLDDMNIHNLRMAQKNLLKTCSMILVVYLLCWLPLEVAFIMYALSYQSKVTTIFNVVGKITSVMNSGLNPYIYAYRYGHFKRQLRYLLTKNPRSSSSSSNQTRRKTENDANVLH